MHAAPQDVYIILMDDLIGPVMRGMKTNWLSPISVCLTLHLVVSHLLFFFLFLSNQLHTQIWKQNLQGLIQKGRAAPQKQKTSLRGWSLQPRRTQSGGWQLQRNLTLSLDHQGRLHRLYPGRNGRKVKETKVLILCQVLQFCLSESYF